MKKTNGIIISLCALLILTGCSQMREELGLNRHSPDEFTVVKRAPLTMPPGYQLMPPGESTNVASAERTSDEAKTAVFGTKAQTKTTPDNSEQAFLQKIGADQANASIRTTIDRESGYVTLEKQSTIDKIFKRNSAEDAIIVDAEKEAERLRENAQSGRPITSGEVPTIEKKQSTLDKLF